MAPISCIANPGPKTEICMFLNTNEIFFLKIEIVVSKFFFRNYIILYIMSIYSKVININYVISL